MKPILLEGDLSRIG